MSEIFRKMTACLKETFSPSHINKMARETKFVQRQSPLTAEKFMALCIFLNRPGRPLTNIDLVSGLRASGNVTAVDTPLLCGVPVMI